MSLPPWLDDPWNRAAARVGNGSLPHALLIAGPPALGKRAFAERLAALLLCHEPGAAPCGRCRSCVLFANRAQRDPEELRPDGSPAHPRGHTGHPDARFVGHVLNDKTKKMYTEIVVEQIRDLSAWLALTPQYGHGQVALIDPADAMNPAAANALLKTLEEPSARRYLLLVSAFPARIPPTIRSRCQRIDVALPAADLARDWLLREGLERASADAALDAADGNPGLALRWSRDGSVALRGAVAGDLRALAQGRAQAAQVAAKWAAAEADTCIWFAAALARREADAQARRESGPLALTGAGDLTKLSAWFDRANQARELLRGPLRAELVVLDLLHAWRSATAPRSGAA